MKVIGKNTLAAQGTVFLLASIAMLGMSWFNYSNPKQDSTQFDLYRINTIKDCNKDMGKFGFVSSAESKNGTVTYTKSELSEWNVDLAISSYIVRECKGMDLEYFCMGSNCQDDAGKPIYGTTMTLKFMEPLKTAK